MALAKSRASRKPLRMDAKLRALLEQVNSEGNAQITWADDQRVWGENDNWDFPCAASGRMYDDCDGFSLWKMRRLIELGVPSSPLLLGWTYDETGTGHLVLIVATDAGDFVLDNRMPRVWTTQEATALGYNFMWRAASGDDLAGPWLSLKHPSPTPEIGTKPKVPPQVNVLPATVKNLPLCLPTQRVASR